MVVGLVHFRETGWGAEEKFKPRPPEASGALERAGLGSNRGGIPKISGILIQPVGWAEASRRWQSRIRKTCVTA